MEAFWIGLQNLMVAPVLIAILIGSVGGLINKAFVLPCRGISLSPAEARPFGGDGAAANKGVPPWGASVAVF